MSLMSPALASVCVCVCVCVCLTTSTTWEAFSNDGKMLYLIVSVQYGSPYPHEVVEQLKCVQCDGGTEAFILFSFN